MRFLLFLLSVLVLWSSVQGSFAAAAVVRVSASSSGGVLNEDVAETLNYTHFDYTLLNALHHKNPKICINEALTIGAANVADLLTYCSVEEIKSSTCHYVTPELIRETLAQAGFVGGEYVGVELATSLPASYFNWTLGEGLAGEKGWKAALLAMPTLLEKLGPELSAQRLNLAGAGTAVLRTDLVYTFVVLGASSNQTCYGDGPGQQVFSFGGPDSGYITAL
ncbi:hypothetical protein CCYA_CCYA13G3533 [Cyanidiococcus yangmingshanensis]|nr:hypothetical protein CCYA_CCYA13G3533 [Cyanidiococcus yangmingshanensis]